MRALFFPEKDAPVADFSKDWEMDQICSELSRLAYVRFEKRDRPRLERVMEQAGFAEIECFNDKRTGAQAFGAVSPGGPVFVAFRGTQITSLRDLLADVSAIPVKWPGEGLVHYGFWASYRSIRDAIDEWLPDLPDRPLVLTGHSLGAAMATLMAALHPRAELVTFGSPRVGNAAFRDSFSGRKVRRYVDCTDGVPRLPPPVGYEHLGEMRYIDHLGNLHSPPHDEAALRQDRRTARRIYRRKYAWRVGNVCVRSGADHAPVNYISALLGRRDGP
jgi:pimeloyl-ACP methyl ester carboxylesterase